MVRKFLCSISQEVGKYILSSWNHKVFPFSISIPSWDCSLKNGISMTPALPQHPRQFPTRSRNGMLKMKAIIFKVSASLEKIWSYILASHFKNPGEEENRVERIQGLLQKNPPVAKRRIQWKMRRGYTYTLTHIFFSHTTYFTREYSILIICT